MEEALQKALNYSFLLLKYRPRSKWEIATRLKKKKFTQFVIDGVLKVLEEHKYIGDSEFVRLFIAASLEKGWGKRKIVFALKRLGVPAEVIEKASLQDFANEGLRLREILQTMIKKYQGKKNYREKVLRSLLRRGFAYDDIMSEIEQLGIF